MQLADLNGDGIPDLIVANSGSNNVLIYPGLGNGQFGPALNGGHGFFTGTNPVGITVADVDGDGRPDLVVANKGSNDVSILLNQKQGNSITFTPGPRLKVGSGPVSTVVRDFLGDGISRPPGQQQPVEQCHVAAGRRRRLLQRPEPHDLSPWAASLDRCSSATSTASPTY